MNARINIHFVDVVALALSDELLITNEQLNVAGNSAPPFAAIQLFKIYERLISLEYGIFKIVLPSCTVLLKLVISCLHCLLLIAALKFMDFNFSSNETH